MARKHVVEWENFSHCCGKSENIAVLTDVETKWHVYSSWQKYVPIELITATICRKPPDDFVSVGKLSEQIRAR
jgi:hypothetical protein